MENINDLVAASKLVASEAEYVEMVEDVTEFCDSDFTFAPAGVSEDEKIIFLISDKEYGEYSIAVKLLDDAKDQEEDTFGVEYDFLSAEKDTVPVDRQEQVVEAIISFIVEQVARYAEDIITEKETGQLDAVDYVSPIIV